MEVQVTKANYFFNRYVDKKRWASYYDQINEALAVSPRKLLVIGVGDGIVVEILRMQGIEVYTMDFDASLNPDFNLDVRNIDELPLNFDVILCCQVLEHIPFADFEATLDKLMEKTNRLVLSLPMQHSRPFSFFKIQRAFFKRIAFSVPRYNKVFHFDGEHYWEMNTKGYLKSKISKIIAQKYHICKSYIQPDNVYHFYYIIENEQCV